ncbi:MAG: asparagine synthase (glutamine-hydrolyzing), partial [Chitinophagaceae bacterium]|nr:asparagine synthase (glutamine-hydrolyzing) [Chitinophagaceae bacterium]
MCGITGIISFSSAGKDRLSKVKVSADTLFHRGPDGGNYFMDDACALGHRRLSIIDTSSNGAQPMKDPTGRYVLIFNGEIFNYQQLKQQYFPDKQDWQSQSDTEVLLHLYIKLKEQCLPLLGGFFALAIYDMQEKELFLARDRYGKKPVYYHHSPADFFAFASELNALQDYGMPKQLDMASLQQYLQLNYIPEPYSIYKDVKKLRPGHYMKIKAGIVAEQAYYELDWRKTDTTISYEAACHQLEQLMDASVQGRMISDVPLGAFLSGGIDSSVVVALASRYTQQLNTFSIGYKDHPFFDETKYAQLVAKKYNTKHTVFSLTNEDFLAHIDAVMNSIDEPFADSSAIPVYILSQHTRSAVTVALSGDGGDEVFAGYNKHAAELRMRRRSLLNSAVKAGGPLWKLLPQSRNNKLTNLFRQLNRFAEGAILDMKERYWRWAGFMDEKDAAEMLRVEDEAKIKVEVERRKEEFLWRMGRVREVKAEVKDEIQMEDFLATDMGLVLLSDMLVKVDRMSMANSLEVRSPFLDHTVVDFAFSLPTSYKIDKGMKKKIVQDTFRKYLPAELYNRPKHGFEIPLLDWFRKELKGKITDDLLNDRFVEE